MLVYLMQPENVANRICHAHLACTQIFRLPQTPIADYPMQPENTTRWQNPAISHCQRKTKLPPFQAAHIIPMTPNVLLLHGLHMNALAMKPLGKRLAAHGFIPHYFSYTKGSLKSHAIALAEHIQHNRILPTHFVAHSLGGLLLRHLAAIHPELLQARAVTLGSPHQGSQTAQRVKQIMPRMIGDSWQNALDGSLPNQPLPIECGSIAGTVSAGLGRLVTQFAEPNDGTVALAETALPNSQQLVVPCSHSGLLFDDKVAQQVAYFLQHGRFRETQATAG